MQSCPRKSKNMPSLKIIERACLHKAYVKRSINIAPSGEANDVSHCVSDLSATAFAAPHHSDPLAGTLTLFRNFSETILGSCDTVYKVATPM